MGSLFEWLIVILFLFAVLDLIVGVANDAVNFLNSALGSKVASKTVILTIASIGIIFGAMSSSGMMEVARRGIFNPEMFSFWNIMIIFVAVVITDVLLLDFYNTLRLPTSTTVSIVFELLGASVAVALLHVIDIGDPLSSVVQYINVKNASDIASSILLSVGISFSVGLIVQYITRFFFTYEYEKKLPSFGAIFGGVAITIITYFLLIKGIKDSSFITADQYTRITDNMTFILVGCVTAWTVLLQVGQSIGKRNIPKIVVLVGTFALAAAFAGNDLVNFIGVSMAGYNSYLLFMQSGGADPTTFMMGGLAGKVPTQFFLLFAAGAIMIITLWKSRKALAVTETEIALSRQQSGTERFHPGIISRSLVRYSLHVHKIYERLIPTHRRSSIQERFIQSTEEFQKHKAKPAFDLIRASVNLTVASVLIAIATSMKLPLSTTYVTFMVAMGTALADGVRGRESAVYRVTGVLTVIGGWFLTAFSAFLITGLIATIIWFGGTIAIGVLITIALFLLYKTHAHHDKSTEKETAQQELLDTLHEDLVTNLHAHLLRVFPGIDRIYMHMVTHILDNKDHLLKKDAKQAIDLSVVAKSVKSHIHMTFLALPDEALHHGEKYVQAIDCLRKCASALEQITVQARDYALNQHPDFIDAQQGEIKGIKHLLKDLFSVFHEYIHHSDDAHITKIDSITDMINEHTEAAKKAQLKRIKNNEVGVRNTTLYLNLLIESKHITQYLKKIAHLSRQMK